MCTALPEPVAGLYDGALVGNGEDHELLLQSVAFADGCEQIPAGRKAFDFYWAVGRRGLVDDSLSASVVLRIAEAFHFPAHGSVYLLARHIGAPEGYRGERVLEYLVGKVAGERRGIGAERQQRCALMTLSSLVGYLSGDRHIIIMVYLQTSHEAVCVRGRKDDRHRDVEVSVVISCCRAGEGEVFIIIVVIPPVPPPGLFALYGILYLCSLYGNTGVGLGFSADGNGVAGTVGLVVIVKGNLEGRPLVFFHPYLSPFRDR